MNYEGTKAFERNETRFILKFCSISMLLDPYPHSHYGSGLWTAKSVRIRIHNTADKYNLNAPS
jgi:hypothetical protein